jgi:hypothetical protein
LQDSDQTGAVSFWTLQEFTRVGRSPWYALQQHTPEGIDRQYTGFKHEMDTLAQALGVTPRMLPATGEAEFWRTLGFDLTKVREPHTDCGVDRGSIVGVAAHAIVQEISPQNLVAHNRHDLERSPAAGKRVAIEYSHGRDSVRDTPLHELGPKAKGLGR